MLLARSSAAALRTVARPASQTVARRTLHFGHIENKVGNNFPFDYTKTVKFSLLFWGGITLGWAVPFVAIGWQQFKVDNQW